MLHAIAFIETATNRIVNLQFPQGEYPAEGLRNEGAIRVVYINDELLPNNDCKNYDYFMSNYCFNEDDLEFVHVGHAPNDYANYNFSTSSWEWDSSLVLRDIRHARNRKLFVTDWTQVPDCSLSEDQKEEARAYRNALREITSSLDNPSNVGDVTWPDLPSFLS